MGSTILNALLEEKIKGFINSFSNLSDKVFYDEETNKLIHPAEYGMFREQICKDFLHFLIPSNLQINQGFIINSKNEISTQCDIIIYDKNTTPLLENTDRQRFFPVETVCAVGEVKSTLSKTKFKETINKLAKINNIRCSLSESSIYKSANELFSPKINQTDNLITFIICQKLDFDLNDLPKEINAMYNDVEQNCKHNMILSINDGIFLYSKGNKIIPYSSINGESAKNALIAADENNMHIKIFASNIFLTSSSATIFFPEMGNYIDDTFNVEDISIIIEQ